MKADVEKAKQKIEEQSNDNQNDDDLVESCDQPDWNLGCSNFYHPYLSWSPSNHI
jgi:hypothetical protein